MKSKTIDWLCNISPAFSQLTPHEMIAIADFTLLWTYFEARCHSKGHKSQ
jgi:hypothetical protein